MDLRCRIDGYFVVVGLMMGCLIGTCVNGDSNGDSVGAPMVKTEQDALYSAIQGFVGNWWNGSDLYPDPCGWTPIQGVSCDVFDGFWYVTDLSIGQIYDNSLPCAPNLEFRPQFFQLKRLKSLTFSNCIISQNQATVSLQTADWDSFSSTLESLEFRANPGLSGQVPTAFGSLKNLQSLVLIDNRLSGSLPVSIGNLTCLKRLVMSGNLFTGKIPENYGYLSGLLIMDLSRNLLSGNVPLTFGGLTSILKFDLSKNQLEGVIPSEISNLKSLTLLDLSNNNISGGLNFSIQEMSSLEELVLSNNPINGDLVDFNWQNVYKLMVLDLSNTGLTGVVPESVSNLKNLRFLGLNDNKLSGSLSPKLAELGNLTALYVHGNNLTGDLKFPREFYQKMGRRFGAWNNSNLCFPISKVSSRVRPFGVKLCRERQL
ncbi:putative leucine-rich repeat domain superfamily [Helianthus annuus]|uniref:Leucine-rich repeat domain superfamily n=1 Tax=Helianthus annuus TaxID=4232 RepID=A0A251S384_HELAN|nr:piriformospora indica-insensitive protein 2 [Helianthus annuus]KAF5762173.1 putative leucine-rich repeat domain superfamily [Helianthus annuus]KAJ0823293.1 putative leucine-rich repeat domain superfamily [Helianthus annuus]